MPGENQHHSTTNQGEENPGKGHQYHTWDILGFRYTWPANIIARLSFCPLKLQKKKKAKETRDTRSKAKQTSEGKQNHTLGCPGPEGQTD